MDVQPKAAGSSLIAKLTTSMALDALRIAGKLLKIGSIKYQEQAKRVQSTACCFPWPRE
jgi:hypothetical protein